MLKMKFTKRMGFSSIVILFSAQKKEEISLCFCQPIIIIIFEHLLSQPDNYIHLKDAIVNDIDVNEIGKKCNSSINIHRKSETCA